jgi:hypothetical protein
MPLYFCLLTSPSLCSIRAYFGLSPHFDPKRPTQSKDSIVPCNLYARNAIIESLSGSLSALTADVEELHTRLCVTHLTLEEDGLSSSASWVVAVSLDTG